MATIRRPLLTFVLLAFAITWTLWFVSGLASPEGAHGLLFLLGVFSPGIVALGLTARETGRAGVRALLQRLIDWDLPARWYLVSISCMAVVKLVVALVHRVLWNEWPRFGQESWIVMLAATLSSTLLGGQAGEELGWRGYALPGLTARFGTAMASLLLGVVWALWHLPLFLFPGGDTYSQSFPLYVLQVTAISVIMAWVFVNTRGSLLPVMLLHAAINNTKDIVPSAELGATDPWALSHSRVAWLTVGVLWLIAGYALFRLRAPSRVGPVHEPE